MDMVMPKPMDAEIREFLDKFDFSSCKHGRELERHFGAGRMGC